MNNRNAQAGGPIAQQPAPPPPNPAQTPSNITVDPHYLDTFTATGRESFTAIVADYAERLKHEAAGIERIERGRNDTPDITRGHVEEARWVLLRRMRSAATSSSAAFLVRLGQVLCTLVTGIAASNLDNPWGVAFLFLGVLLTSALIHVEREMQREL